MSIYSDLPYDLTINEFGDVELLEDSASIKQALKTIVLTKLGTKTKYQNPIFGSDVADLLFEKLNPFTESNLEEEVVQAIQNWEPRVRVDSVFVESDIEQNAIKVSITYSVVNLNITDELIINLSVIS
jgi:phage baseplate assembly protein W